MARIKIPLEQREFNRTMEDGAVEAGLFTPEELDSVKEEVATQALDKIAQDNADIVNKFFAESDMMDRLNPRSMISMCSDNLGKKIMEAMKVHPDLLEKYISGDESALEKFIKPTPMDHALRQSFWAEYNRAQMNNDVIKSDRIYAGVCPADHFKWALNRPHKVLWMILPIKKQTDMMQIVFEKGLRRLYDILDLPLVDSKGKVNTSLANLMLKTTVVLDVRLRGQATQRIEVNNTHEVKMTPEEIDKKLRELEKEEAGVITIPAKISFTPEEVIEGSDLSATELI